MGAARQCATALFPRNCRAPCGFAGDDSGTVAGGVADGAGAFVGAGTVAGFGAGVEGDVDVAGPLGDSVLPDTGGVSTAGVVLAGGIVGKAVGGIAAVASALPSSIGAASCVYSSGVS